MKIKNEENISRVKWAIKNKVSHFAPTISPAPKNVERNEIESIYNALAIYKENGVTSIIIEPKYMGSYCDILVTEDINNSIFYSKKGYIIDYIDRNKLIDALKPIHDKLSEKYDWAVVSEILIQSELLPWSALGQGLIKREFKAYNNANKIHYDYLKESGIIDKINKIKQSSKLLDYNVDKNNLTLSELAIKYKPHEVRFNNAFSSFRNVDVTAMQNAIQKYDIQVERYGYNSDLYEIKPFNILKVFYKNGYEVVNESNLYGFMTLSDDKYVTLDLNDFDISIEKAYSYYNYIIGDLKMEGVVIKPYSVYVENVAPMYKVRSNDYLTLIYGIDFDINFDEYLGKRKVGKKTNSSINEWKISQSLLRIKKADISEDNEYYVDLVEKRIFEEIFEEKLDTRL